ncbi:MAG: hypothetical protein SGJ05_02075 [bacterium]|nr:hypothetical protein [bacterium]
MEMILAILLWMGCISAPNTYQQSQIDAYTTQGQQVINSVLASQSQQEIIWQQYGAVVPTLDIVDPFK